MTGHPIRIMINDRGILCAECDCPVAWVVSGHLPDGAFVGHWDHIADPDEVAASMRRHPAGRGRLP